MAGAQAGSRTVSARRDGPTGGGARSAATALVLAAIMASAAVLLYETRAVTFLLDEWEILLFRRGFNADALLNPHNEHLYVGAILIYKALLELFGMDSARPFQVVSIATFLAGAGLLFAWLRSRVDEWLALGATLLVLFLGAAWEDLLWAFQVGTFGSMACGLGMLIALRRETVAADRVACGLLIAGLAFSSVGIPFAIGAAVALGTGPSWRRRAYVVALPALLYGLWWVGWGHTADSHVSLHNLAVAPVYALDSIASALASLLGLATPRGKFLEGPYEWGRPLAVAGLIAVGWRLHRLGSVPRWLWVVGAVGLSFWLLSGINQFPGRDASASRYQYIGGVFAILIAAELGRGIRVTRAGLVAAGVVVALAVASNLAYLDRAANSFEATSSLIEADLGAVEIARDTVDPGFVLEDEIAGTGYVHVPAGLYLSAADAFGSPAADPAELANAPQPARAAADRVLAAALRVEVTPARAAAGLGGCQRVDPGGTAAGAAVPVGGMIVRASKDADVGLRLRRFSTEEFPVEAGRLRGGEAVSIPIPPDRSTRPWQLQVSGRGAVAVCPQPGD